ncbi:hypothetical protein D3C77_514480 [compost metagenome]
MAHRVYVLTRLFVGNPFAVSASRSDFPIQSAGGFDRDIRQSGRNVLDEPAVQPDRLIPQYTDVYFNPVSPQQLNASSRNLRIWIFARHNYAAYSGLDQPFAARGRRSIMAARFERDIHCASIRRFPRHIKRMDFRMGGSALQVAA